MWNVLKRYLAAYLLGTVCLILGAYGFAALSPLPYTVTPSTVGFFVLLAAVWVAWLAYTVVTAVKHGRRHMVQTAVAFALFAALMLFSSLVAVLLWSAGILKTDFWPLFQAFFLRPSYEGGEAALQGGNLKGVFAVVLSIASVCAAFAVALQAAAARVRCRFSKLVCALLGLAAVVALVAVEEAAYTVAGLLPFFALRKNYDIAIALLVLAGCAAAQCHLSRKSGPP